MVRGRGRGGALTTLLLLIVLGVAACGDDTTETSETTDAAEEGGPEGEAAAPAGDTVLTVYSGRSEELVGPILEEYAQDSGVEVEVRYGDTAEMAATILEEGPNSPADLFFGQDAGALGALKSEGRLVGLPADVVDHVDPRFVDPDGQWVGTSGRARVISYSTDALEESELPAGLLDVADPEWEGRVGWAPTNGSFQAHVTAMRIELGDDTTREWVEALDANGVAYENNTAIVEAVGRGEVDLGLVNHYYLYRFLEEDPDFPVENSFLTEGDVGNLVNLAGLGVLDTAENPAAAADLVRFLLTEEAQQYFADEVFEFPLVGAVDVDPRLPDIDEVDTPDIDLSDLEDLRGTVELLQEAGALP